MTYQNKLSPQDIAVRAHDITVCLERNSVSYFDGLVNLGMAVRLAIHLRGVPAVSLGRQPGSEGSLALPFWDRFLNLVRNLLENPRLCFSIPQIMREAAIDVYYGRDFLANRTKEDLLLIKFAMLVSNYFCKAISFPSQTNEFLEKKFIKKQSDLIHRDEK